MNPLQELERWLRKYLAGVRTVLDPSGTPSGSWFLDVTYGDHSATVEWASERGFGLSGNRPGLYGEKSDEWGADLGFAIGRLLPILVLGLKTIRPGRVKLAELRRMRGMSQADAAAGRGRQQAAVSKVEARGEAVKVSTLMTQIRAMGGKPSIRVSFDDQTEYELQLEGA